MNRLLAVLSLLAAAACDPGTLQDPDRFKACLLNVEKDIFEPKCGSAGCHSAMSPQGGMDLVTPGIAMRIAAGVSTTCQSKPWKSYLAEKLTETPSCGSPMPLGVTLPSNEIKCVRDYLAGISTDGGT